MATPELRGLPLAGSLLDVWRDRLGVVRAASALGDVACFRMGRRRLYLASDPRHVRHVLVEYQDNYRKGIGLEHARPLLGDGLLTSEERAGGASASASSPLSGGRSSLPTWRRCRPRRMSCSTAGSGRSRQARQSISAPNCARSRFEIFLRTLFEAHAGADSSKLERALTLLLDEAIRRMLLPVPRPERLRTPRARRVQRALALLDEQVDALVARRPAPANLLSTLVTAHRDQDRAQLRDELLTLIVAGHETTAVALSWTLYLLGVHPDVAEDVRADRSLLRPVVKEALRLYPPVWLIPRRAVEADRLGRHRIPAGADVLISPYTLHRDPSLWDRPETFSPARFADARPPSAYLPFGIGPRNCVGSAFALVEIELVLGAIVDRFRLRPAAPGRPAPNPLLTLRPPDPFPFRMTAARRPRARGQPSRATP